MAHKIERRMIKDQDILLVYKFEDISNEKPYCADTWISMHNWTSIYEQLENFLDPDISFDRKQSFDLRDTPLTCSVSWSDVNEPFGRAIIAFLTHCDDDENQYSNPAFISIQITKSTISKFTKQISSLKKEVSNLKYELKKSKNTFANKASSQQNRSESNNAPSYKPEATKKSSGDSSKGDANPYTVGSVADHEEYVPNAVRTDKNLIENEIKYEPGRVPETNGQNSATIANVEKYVPPQVSPVVAGKPKYIPSSSSTISEPTSQSKSSSSRKPNETIHSKKTSKFRSGREQHQTNHKAETRSNRRNNAQKTSNRKRGHSPDLFGTDDDTSELPTTAEDAKSSSEQVSKSKVTSSTSSKANYESNKKRTNNKVTNNNNFKSNNVALDSKPRQPQMMSSEDFKKFMDTKDEAISEMKKLSVMLKPEVLPDVEVLTLKHISPSELESRFEEHKSELQVLFDSYCKQKYYVVKKPKDLSALCYNYLLDGAQQLKMMDVLTSAFGGLEELPVYNELFWKLLMPEWTLAMFMSLNGFTRSVATERMRLQERIAAAQFKIEDTMSMSGDESFEKLYK